MFRTAESDSDLKSEAEPRLVLMRPRKDVVYRLGVPLASYGLSCCSYDGPNQIKNDPS